MKTLLHLSFNDSLGDVLTPRQPSGSGMENGKFKEDLPPRVSFSPTVQQCFSAIYPNISKFFEEVENGKGYPYIYCYVYKADLTGREEIVPDSVVKAKVWDAHVTAEVCILTPVKIKKVARIKIPNPYHAITMSDINARPYNNPKKAEVFVSPKIEFVVVEQYDKSVKLK